MLQMRGLSTCVKFFSFPSLVHGQFSTTVGLFLALGVQRLKRSIITEFCFQMVS